MRNYLVLLAACLLWAGSVDAQSFVQHGLNQPAALSGTAGADQLVCPNVPVTLGGSPTASNGHGGYTYLWSPATGLNSTTIPNPIAILTSTTTYTVTITDGLLCTVTDTVTVNIDSCVGLSPLAGGNQFDLYPNPSGGAVTVTATMTELHASLQLQVVDVTGRIVYSQPINNPGKSLRTQLSLGHLPKGSYRVRLIADGQEIAKSLILQ